MHAPTRKLGRRRGGPPRGQVVVEFTVAFATFLLIFFAIIDFTICFNVLVSLNSVVAHAASTGTANDPTGIITVADVEAAVAAEADQWGLIDQSKLTTDVDLNYQTTNGTFHTRVTVDYTYDFITLPKGSIPLQVTSVRMNEIQMFRP